MNAGNLLRASEASALSNSQFIANVKGKGLKDKSGGRKIQFSVMFLVTLAIAIIAVLFTSGNLIPSAISERIIEETDVQYADAVESKIIVFAEAMKAGDIPKDTANILEENGAKVVITESGAAAIEIDGKTVSAQEFYDEIHNNIHLYNAFTDATYGRAAYYYDDAANEVFSRYGTRRNNFTADSSFEDTMESLIGKGSNISTNNVALVKRTVDENGETKVFYEYVETGPSTNSLGNTAEDFINSTLDKNSAGNVETATMKSAETLNIADTVSKEYKSGIFFLAFMENISKMKAGEGGDSKINETMSFLNKVSTTEVVDVNTGEVVKVTGSPLESPSLYSMLSKETLKKDQVANYASDRVLKTIENKTGVSSNVDTLQSITASTSSKIRGSIGNYADGSVISSYDNVSSVTPTIDRSLINNSFSDINGVYAGELLAEGAVNVGKELAKASGATPGSADAAMSYNRLTSKILAMDAEIDRMNRSPFDITSKNTFLGSIVYNLAIHIKPINFVSQFSSIGNIVGSSIMGLLPSTYADDNTERYLGNYGSCRTIESIGAVGSASCSEIATFDTSTLGDIFNDAGFIDFLNKNTVIENGVRTIVKNSVLDIFIKYNNKRITPIGVMDGGILTSVKSGFSNITGVSTIIEMVKNLNNSNDQEKRIATGAAFVNSASNPDWQFYKYAQRYVSLSRATASLRKYSNDETAYSNLEFFETKPSTLASK